MRYMWIPHTDTVVVVTCDPISDSMPAPPAPTIGEYEATAPLRELLLTSSRARGTPVSRGNAAQMNFAQLRDALLALAPLDREHVIKVNRAEAAFWQRSQGFRVDWYARNGPPVYTACAWSCIHRTRVRASCSRRAPSDARECAGQIASLGLSAVASSGCLRSASPAEQLVRQTAVTSDT